MTKHLFLPTSIPVAALLLCLTLPSGTVSAQSPKAVQRTFAFKTSTAQLPDFGSDDSIAVVVAPRSQTSSNALFFVADPGVDKRLDGTKWHYQQASHLTLGNETLSGSFLWLATDEVPEPPPSGAMTMTGPGTVQDVFFISLCDCGGLNAGKYVVDNVAPQDIFVVVTATFSR